jgi:hypothetical protein
LLRDTRVDGRPEVRNLRIGLVAGAFVGVRMAAWALGLRFDASQEPAFWHFIEPQLLEDRLLESLFYLHSQPPLFNLWLGAYHQLFGSWMPAAFGATYAGLGILLAVQMHAAARALGVSAWTRTVGVGFFCTSPAVLLYEHFLLYAYPVAVLLTWSAVRFHRALVTGRERHWWGFVLLALAIVMMRALYHPVWLGAVLAAAAWAQWRLHGTIRPLVKPALVAGVIVLALLVKNQIVFDRATLSSFGGMNLSRAVLDRMAWEDLTAMVDSGAVSPWAMTGAFQTLPNYWPTPATATTTTGIPLLDRPLKADGSINLHHRAYVEISAQLGRDSWTVIRTHPAVYARSVWMNLQQTLHPATTYAPLAASRETIAPLVRVYEPLLGWIPALGPMGVWPVLLPLVLGAALVHLGRRRASLDAGWILTAYLVVTVVYVVAVGSLVERSENQRFRFDVDPFIWTLLLVGVERLRRFARSRWTATPSVP